MATNTVFPTHADYRTSWENAFHKDPQIPLNIDLELARVCNLTCPFCFLNSDTYKQQLSGRARFMASELALKVLLQASQIGVPAVKFNWRGESTLHPKFAEICLFAARKCGFYDILVNTNGNCSDIALQGLLYCSKVMISVDSFNPKTYETLRQGGDLERAKYCIKWLIKNKHQNIWIRRVKSKVNETEDFAKDCHKLYGDAVNVSEHHCFTRGCGEIGSVPVNAERTYCGYPSQRLVVAVDGGVFPCCVDYKGTMPIGNVNTDSIIGIWNGSYLKTLRNSLRKNNVPRETQCGNCTSFMAYKVKERELVNDKKMVA